MQILITHGSLARSRVLHVSRAQVALAALASLLVLLLLSGTIYHVVFLKAVRDGWPVVSQVVRFIVRDDLAQRDRFMRENLDAMAAKVGEVQAKLVKLDAMSERVSGLAGVKIEGARGGADSGQRSVAPGGAAQNGVPAGAASATPPPAGSLLKTGGGGQGGPYVPLSSPSYQQLEQMVAALDQQADDQTDLYTYIQSRLLERRMTALSVPNSAPVDGVEVGSGFGFRPDPFTGRTALHTGLDFPTESGTPIHAAAAGVVQTVELNPAYGRMVEIDHGNGLVTRYAHTSKAFVKPGDLVKRGDVIAAVGSSGRSTGPHLHFEVLVEGVPQDPARFLAASTTASAVKLATAAPEPVPPKKVASPRKR